MDLENREVIKICFIAKMFLKRLLGPSSIFWDQLYVVKTYLRATTTAAAAAVIGKKEMLIWCYFALQWCVNTPLLLRHLWNFKQANISVFGIVFLSFAPSYFRLDKLLTLSYKDITKNFVVACSSGSSQF